MENPFIIRHFEMMSIELEKFARGMILWNNYNYELLFPGLEESKMDNNILDTYVNIYKSRENLGEEGNKLGKKIEEYMTKVVEKWNLEEDRLYIREKIRYKIREEVSMYIIFEYICDCLSCMRNNYLVIFIMNIDMMDFEGHIVEENLLDSLIFIQKLVRILKGVINIDKKRKRIMRERMSMRNNIKNRSYF